MLAAFVERARCRGRWNAYPFGLDPDLVENFGGMLGYEEGGLLCAYARETDEVGRVAVGLLANEAEAQGRTVRKWTEQHYLLGPLWRMVIS